MILLVHKLLPPHLRSAVLCLGPLLLPEKWHGHADDASSVTK